MRKGASAEYEMKILITGSRGQLGTEIQKQLSEMKSPIGPIPACYEGADITAVDIDVLDLTKKHDVMNAVTDGRFDLVINCAAMTNVDGCETDMDSAFRANALAPGYLAEACEESGAKLVHVSTDYVFAGDGTRPYTECDAPAPKTAYGATKLLGERYVSERCRRHFIVRTAWLYSLYGKNFVKTIIRAARKNGKVTVVNDQVGNPTNAADLAHHILLLGAGDEYGLYHCTNNGICSWFEFASETLRAAVPEAQCLPCTSEEYPSRTPRPKYSALDNMMLRNTCGDHMRDWKEALSDNLKDLEV